VKGVLIDVESALNGASVMEVVDELDTYYEILKCSCIDIVNRQIGEKRYDIVCDDEGLFKDQIRPSAFGRGKTVMLVGNLFIAGEANEDGELTSLSEDECMDILSHVARAFSKDGNWPVVRDMDF
jgi:hypothetical protein